MRTISEKSKVSHGGSATVEALFCLWILLPIGFGTVAIGKLIDLRQTSEQASRYAVWQSTVGGQMRTSGTESDEVAERFYSDPSRAVVTPGAHVDPDDAGSHPLWGATDRTGISSNRFQSDIQLEKEHPVVVRYTYDRSAATVASGISKTVETLGSLLRNVDGNEWDLSSNGILRSELDAGLHANTWLGGMNADCRASDSGVCVTSSSAILSDGWSAASDTHARKRIRSLMPTSAANRVGDVVAEVGGLFLFPELRGLRGALGHVNMDVLPEYASE